MTRKASPRKHQRKALSPLLSAFTRSADAPSSTNPMILKAFIALDAFKRAKGTMGLFVELAQLLVMSDYLCRAGYRRDELEVCKAATAALMRIDEAAGNREEGWAATAADYAAIQAGVELLDRQLLGASVGDIKAAELEMIAYVLNSQGITRSAE